MNTQPNNGAELPSEKQPNSLHGPQCQSRPTLSAIPEAWSWHLRTLLELRERLLKDRGAQVTEAAEPTELDTTDLADSATDEIDHDMALAMWSHVDDMLQEVDAAIQRIQDGSYGFCQETGKNIPAARLQAMPWARYTQEVEARLEEEGATPGPRVGGLHPISSLSEQENDVPEDTSGGNET